SDDEDKAKKVTVRFEKPETERSRKALEKSYGFLLRQIKEEPWIEVNYHKYGSEYSEFEHRKLYCMYEDEHVDQFNLSPQDYLNQLVPPTEEVKMLTPGLPSHLMCRSGLKSLDLHEHVKTAMINAGVASFTELIEVLERGNSVDFVLSVLKVLQQVAVLVQGNWVVKSELIYPKESKSESGVSNDLVQRGRDFVLYLFTKNTSVIRSEVAEMVRLPGADIKDILSGVSTHSTERGIWEFLLPTDHAFLKKYPEVFQRQQMIWQSRSEQLSHIFTEKIKQEDAKASVSSSRKSHSRASNIDDILSNQKHPVPAKQRKGNVAEQS
ncbi:DNA-directed RNA polymerase III subunit RPC5, partial [Halocaridina rubra]